MCQEPSESIQEVETDRTPHLNVLNLHMKAGRRGEGQLLQTVWNANDP